MWNARKNLKESLHKRSIGGSIYNHRHILAKVEILGHPVGLWTVLRQRDVAPAPDWDQQA